MTEFHWGMIALFVVLTAIYLGAEIYARRALGPRGKAKRDDTEQTASGPAE